MENVEECCSSSESGWTMYLESPSHGDGSDSKDSNISNVWDKDHHHEDEDDDSMASDASSGPARLLRYDDDESCNQCNYKKPFKMEKKSDGRTSVAKERKASLNSASKEKKANLKKK